MSRKRNIQLIFWVSEKERELIAQKMEQVGTENLSAYLRKIAIDGFIIKLDLPELRALTPPLRRSRTPPNPPARRLTDPGRFYDADMEDLLQRQEQLWQAANTILARLALVA